MTDDFSFDVRRNPDDFPDFIEGKRAGVNEHGQRYVIVGGRRWLLDPTEEPLDVPDDPEIFARFPAAPRQISFFGKLTLLLGGDNLGLLTLGCFFACIGMVFMCLFVGVGLADFATIWRPGGEATVTSVEDGDFTVNDREVYAYCFTGKDADGNDFSGVSYQFADKFKEGQTVPVVQGWFFGTKRKLRDADFTKMGNLGWGFCLIGLFSLTFPTIGVCLVWFGAILPGWKRIPLLRDGEAALGTFLRQEGTSMSVNNRNVQKLVYVFETPEGERFEASLRTLRPDKFLDDDRRKIVFYNPAAPKKNMIWEKVADKMKFDEFQQRFTAGFSFNVLIFPVFLAIFCFEIVWFFHNAVTGTFFF